MCSNSFYDAYMGWADYTGYVGSEEESINNYCTKCNTGSIPSPWGDTCGCCDPMPTRWACTRHSFTGGAFFDRPVGGVCVSGINPEFPYATQEECEAGCPEFDCDDFDTLTSQEQGLICCGCDPGCDFVNNLPSELMAMCGCCDVNMRLNEPINPSDVDKIVNKIKNKNNSTQFNRLKELAGLKK